MACQSKTIVLPPHSEFDRAEYTVLVKHMGHWVRASTPTTLSEAEVMADTAHRRSNLPVEVRDALGVVVLALEPPRAAAHSDRARVEYV